MPEVLGFIGRQRGSLILHCGDGYYYNVQEVRNVRVRLRCRHYSNRNGVQCHGTAKVSLHDYQLVHLNPHNHAPDPLLEQDFELRRNMIRDAENNVFGRKVISILNEWKLRTPNVDLASRFTRVRMRSALYSAKGKNYPTIPKTLLSLGILLNDAEHMPICRTVDGTDFLFKGIVGSPHDKSLSLIFASNRMIEFMESRPTLHSDGTFKKRSKKPCMAQIFNIVTKYGDNVVPLVRCLMSSRRTVAYRAILQHLKTLSPNLDPDVVYCDFELAEMEAWRLEFPRARISGCLYHYAVANSSTARELGLTPLARENEIVLTSIAALCASPMLPINLMWRGVYEIWREVEASGWGNELRPLFEHFERYWLPRIDELCVFNVEERTNNASESDNHGLASIIPQNRPNIWHLLGGFVQLEHLSYCDKVALDRLQPVSGSRKWKAVWNDRTVQTAVRLLERRQITAGHFLHRTSYAIMAAIKRGLRLRRQDDLDDSEEDTDEEDTDEENTDEDDSDGED